MKLNKGLLCAVLAVLSMTSLAGCHINEPEQEKPLEVGDTVKEWKSTKDYDALPMDVPNKSKSGTGSGEIVKRFGHEDKCSLKFDVSVGTSTSYVGSDVLKTPYFTDDDVKNGDIISLYVYVPANSNVESLRLHVLPSSLDKSYKGDLITIDESTSEQWIRTTAVFNTLETLGGIRLVYKAVDQESPVTFYIDDINITYGEETVKTDYTNREESLYKTYQDYFKVGACMSGDMIKNTMLRQIAKDNFNSLTAENEGKPERILDQKQCQALAKEDETAVAITVTPFEKIYDFCEAHHIGVRHHTFVWYSQTPAWFFNKGYADNGSKVSKEVMLQRMENFIKVTLETVNNRWPGLVYAIDVSNEAIENGGVRNNNNNWYTVVGKDFVYYSFLYASKYKAEGQKLYYNDFAYDYSYDACKFACNTLLKQAIAENLIDGVGIQGHVDSGANMDILINDAKLIHSKGLECQITELDITVNGTSKTDLNNQKKAYKNLLTKILKANLAEQTNITAVIVWGINDDASWKRNQYPLLFTQNYGKKPAYYGFLEAIESVLPKEEDETQAQ